MLSLGKIPPVAIYCSQRALISQHRNFPISIRLGNGLLCTAFKSKKKEDFSFTTAEMEMEMDGPVEFEEDSEEDEDEENEEDVIIPLQNMKKWMENRPLGFGEGKAYDTSIEDKLMEEIEQSRKAQLANLNKLKDNPTPTKPAGTKKLTDKQEDKGAAKDETGIRVRLTNLPKKKNIHRDLRLVFNRVPGILDIAPVVSGNEKTRDPVCKGLAFVSFNNPNQAHKFVQEFSGISVSFGKVEKRINCELVSPNLPNPMSNKAVPAAQSDEDSNDDSDDSDHVELEVEVERMKEPPRTNDKKTEAKRRKAAVPKLKTITGSAKRLKMREKSVLKGVLTKYGTSDGGEKKPWPSRVLSP